MEGRSGENKIETAGLRAARSRHVQAGHVKGGSSVDSPHRGPCQSCQECADIRTPGFLNLVGSACCARSFGYVVAVKQFLDGVGFPVFCVGFASFRPHYPSFLAGRRTHASTAVLFCFDLIYLEDGTFEHQWRNKPLK